MRNLIKNVYGLFLNARDSTQISIAGLIIVLALICLILLFKTFGLIPYLT